MKDLSDYKLENLEKENSHIRPITLTRKHKSGLEGRRRTLSRAWRWKEWRICEVKWPWRRLRGEVDEKDEDGVERVC